nr:PREDICTED: C-type lectin BpLec [Anolis carolinensis]|eukprot:XP_008113585.1 PREDICTED: C-type lectin BpLec [Anolis carolinensis]
MGLLTYTSLCLFGLLLSSPLTGAEANSCPNDWTEDPVQGNCYAYFDNKLTWREAEMECQSYGSKAHLASILSAEETDFIAKHISTYQHETSSVWMGLYDPRQTGKWNWSDGSIYNYMAWARGQPDFLHGPEYCVELNLFTGFKQWNNNNCKKMNTYICKIKL